MNIKDVIKPNWLKRHITEIIALSTLYFAFYIFKIILLKEVEADPQTISQIIETVKALMYLLFGFYFGSSIGSKIKQEKLDKIEESKAEI